MQALSVNMHVSPRERIHFFTIHLLHAKDIFIVQDCLVALARYRGGFDLALPRTKITKTCSSPGQRRSNLHKVRLRNCRLRTPHVAKRILHLTEQTRRQAQRYTQALYQEWQGQWFDQTSIRPHVQESRSASVDETICSSQSYRDKRRS